MDVLGTTDDVGLIERVHGYEDVAADVTSRQRSLATNQQTTGTSGERFVGGTLGEQDVIAALVAPIDFSTFR